MSPRRSRALGAALAATCSSLLLLLLAGPAGRGAWGLQNGLARRPPMGWLAWERFTCETDCRGRPDDCIGEALFAQMAERLAGDGYLAAGYQYVNIDDCWSELARDSSSGRLVANASRFPSGLGRLADRLHALGLKLGLYGDCGPRTCAGYPGQLARADSAQGNHFELDAASLNEWRVDSFKFDGCFIDPLKAESLCPGMSEALLAGSRPTLLVCEWPFYMMYAHAAPNFTLAQQSCNVWRYYDDIEDSWQSVLNTVDYTVKHQFTIVKYHGPGHWFDPDQLVVGNFGLSWGQMRAQMALWCIWAAPLYMSNDLRAIDPRAAAILKSRPLIEVDQDPLGVLGLMVGQSADGSLQAFVKPVEPVRAGCPSFALVYLNRRTLGDRRKVAFKLRDLLLGAPIHQAAKHQAAGAGAAAASIQANRCLGRLARAMSEPAEGGRASRREEQLRVHYQVADLFEGGRPIGRVGLDAELELVVEPSSVRAVKLEEILTAS